MGSMNGNTFGEELEDVIIIGGGGSIADVDGELETPGCTCPDNGGDTGGGDDNTGSGDDNTGSGGDDNTEGGGDDDNTGSGGNDNTGGGDDDNTGSGGDDNTGSGDDNTGRSRRYVCEPARAQ